jgi:hypothetical protein
MKSFDIPGARNDDASLGVDRHRVDVVSKLVACIERDFKALRCRDADVVSM